MNESLAQLRMLFPPIGGQAVHPHRPPFARHTKPSRCRSLKSSPEHRRSTRKHNSHRRTQINANTTRRFARYFALPVVSAGIIAGAALGLAGAANASTPTEPTGPGHSYSPDTKAHAAPEALPGARNHRGVWHVENLQPGYRR